MTGDSTEPTPPAPLTSCEGEPPAGSPCAPPLSGKGEDGEEATHLTSYGNEGGAGRAWRLIHVLTLLAFLGLWTWKLLEEHPIPDALSARFTDDERFGAAKSLHAGAYAFLAVLAVTLPVPSHWRWFFVGLLALHGAATEIGQTYVPGRTGRVRDVVIDWVGIGLGVLVWRWWRANRVAPADREVPGTDATW